MEIPADETFERLIDVLVYYRYRIESADEAMRGVVAYRFLWSFFGQATGNARLAASVDVAGNNGSLVTIESAPAYRPMEGSEGVHRRVVAHVFRLIEQPPKRREAKRRGWFSRWW